MQRASILSLLSITLGAVACGGGTVDGGDGASQCSAVDATLRPENYDARAIAERLAAAECGFYERCQPATFPFLNFASSADCIANLTSKHLNTFEFIAPAIASGRVQLNAGEIDACSAELGSVDCDLQQDADSACGRIAVGLVGAADGCFMTAECESGLYCKRSAGIGSGGTCSPPAKKGEDCTITDGACELGTLCAQAEGGIYRCVSNDRGDGDSCGTADTGICRGSLMCVGSGNGAGTCRRPGKTAGDACDESLASSPDCDLGNNLACTSGQCAAVTEWSRAGQACSQTQQCDSQSYCPQAGNTCTALPGAGASCGETGACRTGAYCDSSDTCVGERAMGQPCGASFECGGDLACLGLSPTSDGQCGTLSYMLCSN